MINNLELGKKIIKDKIPFIPKNPGVYKMLGAKKEILYIGKAKNIPNRLKSYVSDANLPIRTERMLSLTKFLETTTTSNESEALLLEANLIKKHKPRFNILLRDDKSFPYIFISHKDKWPQLTKLRGKKARDGYYFGPFASTGSANWTIKILQKIFLLRVCDDNVFKNRNRPCILYQIKRCSAPCVGHIAEKDYKTSVEDAVDFISGKSRKIQKNLSDEMEKASKELDFEKAAIARDRIKALSQIQSSQKINQTNLNEADVVSIFKDSGKTCIQVFFFRSKQNWGNQAYFPKHDPDDKLEHILSSFLTQFYENKSIPSLIITNHFISERDLLEKTFKAKEDKEIILREAKNKEEKHLTSLAEKNAKQALTQRIYETQSNSNLIDDLIKKFNLNNNINYLEVYDNSHIQGTDASGVDELADAVDGILSHIKSNSANAVLESKYPFLKLLSESNKQKFYNLDSDTKTAIVETMRGAIFFTEGEVINIMESVMNKQVENTPAYVRFMPEKYKTVFESMNDAERNWMAAQASTQVINTPYQAKAFWDSRDLRPINERITQANNINNQTLNESQGKEGYISLVQVNESLRGYSNGYLDALKRRAQN